MPRMRTLAFMVLFRGSKCDMSRPSNGAEMRRDAEPGPSVLGGCIGGSNDSPFGVSSSSVCDTLCRGSPTKMQLCTRRYNSQLVALTTVCEKRAQVTHRKTRDTAHKLVALLMRIGACAAIGW